MNRIFIGVFCILFAALGILDALNLTMVLENENVAGGITFLQIGFLILFILASAWCIIKSKLFGLLFFITVFIMVFERNIANILKLEDDNIINNWLLVLFAILIYVGIKLIVSGNLKTKVKSSANKKFFQKGSRNNCVYINCADFTTQSIENNMGLLCVRFDNTDTYKGGGLLFVENNLGRVQIYVPKEWVLDVQVENNLGFIAPVSNEGKTGHILTIKGENNLGNIQIYNV